MWLHVFLRLVFVGWREDRFPCVRKNGNRAVGGAGGRGKLKLKPKERDKSYMKINGKVMLLLAATASAGALLFAQDNAGNGQGAPPEGRGPGQPGPGGPGGHHRPPPPAIIAALDANHDGVIDADEIANAVEVLKKLD